MRDDQRLLGLLKQARLDGVYGYLKLTDVFNYIEMFYNSERRNNTSGDVSPVEFEKGYFQRLGSV